MTFNLEYYHDLVVFPARELRPGDLWYREPYERDGKAWAFVIALTPREGSKDTFYVSLFYLRSNATETEELSGLSGDLLYRDGEIIFDPKVEQAKWRAKRGFSPPTRKRR